MEVDFQAYEYRADGVLALARFRFRGSVGEGWTVTRNGASTLELGPGYRLLRVSRCGVCSTDLARRFLPFPLPQITGHEVVALDEDGRRYAVEINAAPVTRGVETDCPFCRTLPNHCPDRLVLGIHDLPGGFGPYILAPIHALHAVPESIDDDAAVLIEPLAAALHAVDSIAIEPGYRIGVLGPRKLGMLVLAALAARRKQHGSGYEIVALSRREDLLELARDLGADRTTLVLDETAEPPAADIVVDCTGSPAGLELAIRAARREVHLKSTHGQSAAGLRHLTELVVDELSIRRFDPVSPPQRQGEGADVESQPVVAWLAGGSPPDDAGGAVSFRRASSPARMLEALESSSGRSSLPRVDAAVVDSIAMLERAIRPTEDREDSLVRPRGAILVTEPSADDLAASPLLRAIWERDLCLTSSRCGDFAAALELLEADADLRAAAPRLITHRFGADQVPLAFQAAAARDSIKAIVKHQIRP